VTPKDLNVQQLLDRVNNSDIKEVIVATNPTPSGDATAAYLARVLEPYGISTSRLAFGLPVGGDIEYADEVTLYRALEGRKNLD
jgi:recombination protein RecR